MQTAPRQRMHPRQMPHAPPMAQGTSVDKHAPVGLCLFLFIVGATSLYDLTLIARVPLSEIIAFASIPFLLYGRRLAPFQNRILITLFFLGLWALGVMISDVYNGYRFGHNIRGLAKPIFCGLWCLVFIGVLLRDYRALIWLPLGEIAAATQNYLFPQYWTIEQITAGGYEAAAYGITPIVVSMGIATSLLLYRKNRLWAVLAFVLTAIALVVAGAPRNRMAIMLLNAALIGYIWFTRRPGKRSYNLSFPRLLGLGVLGLFLLYGIFELYVWTASRGYLGEMQQDKLVTQEQTIFGNTILGVILAGRTAVFASMLAIVDNPIIGYGSWSGITLGRYFVDAIYYVGTDVGQMDLVSQNIDLLGAGHSIFFVAWQESGILAAISLVWIIYISMRGLLLSIQYDHCLTPWVVAITTSFVWAFFFSPFGTSSRLFIGFFLALYIVRIAEGFNKQRIS